MRTIIVIACAALLASCAGAGTFLSTKQDDDTIGARILNDIQGCKRTYRGALGTGVTGSFEISCDPVVVPIKDLGKPGTGTEPAP